jgi:hypothetical protein
VRGETVQVGIRSPGAGWCRVRHSWYIYRDNTDYHYLYHWHLIKFTVHKIVIIVQSPIFFIIIINFHYLLTYLCLSTSPVAKFLVWLAGVESGTRGTSIEILQFIIILICGILLKLQYMRFHEHIISFITIIIVQSSLLSS